MDKKEGYLYAVENGLLEEDSQDFYKLFKSVSRLNDITSTEKIILTIILSYTSRRLEFYMSNKVLAEETGMNYVSVIRCINNLRALKYIKTYKKFRDGKVIGRAIETVRGTMEEQIKNSWGNIKYEEYGNEEEDKELF